MSAGAEMTPARGVERDWHDADGEWLASVVHHPRIEGYWLAMLCADLAGHTKPSGWYRYKTWRGAVALVERKIK